MWVCAFFFLIFDESRTPEWAWLLFSPSYVFLLKFLNKGADSTLLRAAQLFTYCGQYDSISSAYHNVSPHWLYTSVIVIEYSPPYASCTEEVKFQ